MRSLWGSFGTLQGGFWWMMQMTCLAWCWCWCSSLGLRASSWFASTSSFWKSDLWCLSAVTCLTCSQSRYLLSMALQGRRMQSISSSAFCFLIWSPFSWCGALVVSHRSAKQRDSLSGAYGCSRMSRKSPHLRHLIWMIWPDVSLYLLLAYLEVQEMGWEHLQIGARILPVKLSFATLAIFVRSQARSQASVLLHLMSHLANWLLNRLGKAFWLPSLVPSHLDEASAPLQL